MWVSDLSAVLCSISFLAALGPHILLFYAFSAANSIRPHTLCRLLAPPNLPALSANSTTLFLGLMLTPHPLCCAGCASGTLCGAAPDSSFGVEQGHGIAPAAHGVVHTAPHGTASWPQAQRGVQQSRGRNNTFWCLAYGCCGHVISMFKRWGDRASNV